jgi:lactoylglutathione lyase
MMNKLTFDHIHLFTRDPEATATFYERMFGAEVIRSTQEGKPRIDLKLGGANVFILDVNDNPKAGAGPAHPHQGLDHFGLQVKNIDAVCAELKSKGAMFSREPVTIRPGTRIAFVTGPDGVSIELLERTPIA